MSQHLNFKNPGTQRKKSFDLRQQAFICAGLKLLRQQLTHGTAENLPQPIFDILVDGDADLANPAEIDELCEKVTA